MRAPLYIILSAYSLKRGTGLFFRGETVDFQTRLNFQRSFRRKRDHLAAALPFLLLKILEDPCQVIVETSSMLFANLSDFFDNWVLPHEIQSPISSSGVQMVGGSYPALVGLPRQRHRHHGALPRRALDADLAIMRQHQLAGDGEAETGAARAGPLLEALEDVRQIFRRDP